MKKAFTKYFLFAFILFLGSYSYVITPSEPNNHLETHQISLSQHSTHSVTASINISKPKHHLEPYEVELEEEEDEKTNWLKRLASSGKFFLVLSFALILGYFYKLIKKRSPSNEQSYHFSLFKWFILFQVFRI